jgi:hypothetical protein
MTALVETVFLRLKAAEKVGILRGCVLDSEMIKAVSGGRNGFCAEGIFFLFIYTF